MRMIAADLMSNSFSMCGVYRHGLVDMGSMAGALHFVSCAGVCFQCGICCEVEVCVCVDAFRGRFVLGGMHMVWYKYCVCQCFDFASIRIISLNK